MSRDETLAEPAPRLEHRLIDSGEARVAVFERVYDAAIEDVWDACTDPDRLRRWYMPVSGDLRVGGSFEQASMGSGKIVRCVPPRHLKVSLGDEGQDEIDLRLSTRSDGSTALELQHATTLDEHLIGGQMYDAIFCMGGGYYPRFYALDRHLRGTLPDGYEPLEAHLDRDIRPLIARGSSAMAALLEENTAVRRR